METVKGFPTGRGSEVWVERILECGWRGRGLALEKQLNVKLSVVVVVGGGVNGWSTQGDEGD